LFLIWLSLAPIPDAASWSIVVLEEIKRQRYIAKLKNWESSVPAHVRQWANIEFKELSSQEFNCDNFRVAATCESSQIRRYYRQYKLGCCGSIDIEKIGPDGKVYLLGFDYGH
jgi:hypothetical protein